MPAQIKTLHNASWKRLEYTATYSLVLLIKLKLTSQTLSTLSRYAAAAGAATF